MSEKESDSLATRLATKLAAKLEARRQTEQAIARRNTEIASFRKRSYAEALTDALKDDANRVQLPPKSQVRGEVINGTNHQTQGRQEARQDNTVHIAKVNEEEGGWTVVRRKRPPTTRLHIPTPLSKCKQELLAQGRCFRCLQQGHRRFECKGILKCLKCSQAGHTAGKCETKTRLTGQTHNSVKFNQTGGGYNRVIAQPTKAIVITPGIQQPVNATLATWRPINTQEDKRFIMCKERKQSEPENQNSENMDILANWETMQMNDPAYVQNHHDNTHVDTRVFLQLGNSPNEEFLERSAVILTGPNHNDTMLMNRLTTKLAQHFTRHPRQFKVRKLPPSMGDLIAIFPNRDMMKQAVQVGMFNLGAGVQVQLAAFKKEDGMTYDPTTHKARIRIHNLPFRFWHWEAIAQLVSGFGQLERIAPYFTNDNYEELRVLVGCYHPMKVPPYVTSTADPLTVTVQLELEGWLHNEALQTGAPYTGGENTDQNQPDQVNDEARYWDEQWRDGVRRRMQRGQNSYDSGQSSGPVTGYNRRRRQNRDGETDNMELERRSTVQNGDKDQVKTVNFQIDFGRQTKHTKYEFSVKFNQSQQELWIYGSTINKEVSKVLFIKCAPNIQFQLYSVTGLKGNSLATTHLEIMEHQDGPFGPATEDETNVGSPGSNEEASTDSIDGPPPGFPGPPKYASPRRSRRLNEKYSGVYISPEERARIITKPDSAAIPQGRPKKKTTVCQAQLEYFKTYAPLSQAQAELVIMAAGVELQGEMQQQISALLMS